VADVNAPQPGRTGVLVVRLWTEGGGDQQLRARVTQTLDVQARDQLVTTCRTGDDICQAVRGWIEAFMASPARATRELEAWEAPPGDESDDDAVTNG
jgi:hypothetical protein